MPLARRFPPPWSVEELNDACFVVRDHDGQQLAYVYFEDEPGRRSAAKPRTRREGSRLASVPSTTPLPGLPKPDPISACASAVIHSETKLN